jgi:mycothiol synthase
MGVRVTRNVDDADLAALKELLSTARAHDDHDPLGEHKWLDLVHGDGFAGVLDEKDGTLAGYAHIAPHTGAQWGLEVVVHPNHRDGSVQRELVSTALRYVADEGGGRVHYWVFCQNDSDDELVRELGFERGRDLLNVCVDLPVALETKLPSGVRIRAFEPGRDEQAWLDVNNRAFDHHPEQSAWTLEMMRRRMGEPWFDPADFLLAVDDSGIAGFDWTKLHHDRSVGEIYVIGVDPSRQQSGLGKALTLAGLEHMSSRGIERCCLYVDSANAGARAMYDKIGFRLDHLDRAYVTDVPAT